MLPVLETEFFFFLFVCLKQAYVQQLESSRIKLTQLEQDLQRARSQVFFPFTEKSFFPEKETISFLYYLLLNFVQ